MTPLWPELQLTINGQTTRVSVPPMKRLLDVLREDVLREDVSCNGLPLTGTKEGCGEGECGSCSVLMNGELVNSCLVPILQAQGAEITTIEGLAIDGELHPLQRAFLECGGAQCGICTPGMLMAATHLLAHNPHPTTEEIREGLAGNLCRCTGFVKIFDAVAAAAQPHTQQTKGAAPNAR